jgi:hypothetical protein
MLSVTKFTSQDSSSEIRNEKRPTAVRRSGHTGTLWWLRKQAGRVQGGTTKGIGHDNFKTPAIDRLRRKPFLSGAAAP